MNHFPHLTLHPAPVHYRNLRLYSLVLLIVSKVGAVEEMKEPEEFHETVRPLWGAQVGPNPETAWGAGGDNLLSTISGWNRGGDDSLSTVSEGSKETDSEAEDLEEYRRRKRVHIHPDFKKMMEKGQDSITVSPRRPRVDVMWNTKADRFVVKFLECINVQLLRFLHHCDSHSFNILDTPQPNGNRAKDAGPGGVASGAKGAGGLLSKSSSADLFGGGRNLTDFYRSHYLVEEDVEAYEDSNPKSVTPSPTESKAVAVPAQLEEEGKELDFVNSIMCVIKDAGAVSHPPLHLAPIPQAGCDPLVDGWAKSLEPPRPSRVEINARIKRDRRRPKCDICAESVLPPWFYDRNETVLGQRSTPGENSYATMIFRHQVNEMTTTAIQAILRKFLLHRTYQHWAHGGPCPYPQPPTSRRTLSRLKGGGRPLVARKGATGWEQRRKMRRKGAPPSQSINTALDPGMLDGSQEGRVSPSGSHYARFLTPTLRQYQRLGLDNLHLDLSAVSTFSVRSGSPKSQKGAEGGVEGAGRGTPDHRKRVRGGLQKARELLPKAYQCCYCPKKFFAETTLAGHLTVHMGMLPYHCQRCNQRFRFIKQLNAHVEEHLQNQTYRCSFCNKRFRTEESLVGHQVFHMAGFLGKEDFEEDLEIRRRTLNPPDLPESDAQGGMMIRKQPTIDPLTDKRAIGMRIGSDDSPLNRTTSSFSTDTDLESDIEMKVSEKIRKTPGNK